VSHLRVLLNISGAICATGCLSAQTPGPRTTASQFQVVEATIDQIHAAFKSGEITCRQLVGTYLRRIEAYDKAGPGLNAVQTVNGRALQEADLLDAAFGSSGPVGKLHCIPVLVKDQLEMAGLPTTFGSAVFKDFFSQRDATVVARLKGAGAIIIAKANMGEFASGIVGFSGPIRNAYDPRRHASGSSGGTGSGIAANFATVGIGEDTSGSVRGPASVSSLVGLRPTVPLVSRYGMFPAKPTSDTVGPMTRTVKDAAILLDAIAGYDPNDKVTAYAVGHIPVSYTDALKPDGLKGARLGVIRQPMDQKAQPGSEDYKKVKGVIDKAISDLTKLGAEVVDPVEIPDLIETLNKTYDGNVFETERAVNDFLRQRPNSPVRTLGDILLTGKVLPSRARVLMNTIGKSTNDQGYAQYQQVVEASRQSILSLMADRHLDALVYATFDQQPVFIAPDVMTRPVIDDDRIGSNRKLSPFLGFPALTLPAGFTTDGMPVGIEFMSRPFSEEMLLKFGYVYEQATRNRRPPGLTPALPSER
jgi:amidase